MTRLSGRAAALLAICVAAVLVAGVALGVGIWRSSGASDTTPTPVGTGAAEPGALIYIAAPEVGKAGAVSWAPPAVWRGSPAPLTPQATGLTCHRVYAAGGRGICLAANRAKTGFVARLFGRDFRPTTDVKLAGTPSRARVSADGRYGAVTTFVTGDSYTDANFSTRTTIIDMERGTVVSDLEKFATSRDGAVIDAPDVNYWGVTFAADSNRFYATLGTGDKTYLIQGDVAARTATTIHENVECPSLSPDGTRVAYKKLGADEVWHFTVLDLASDQETAVTEPSSVDDQIEWLDNDTLAYGTVLSELWAVPADGTGAPRRLLTAAQSPSVVR